MFVTRFIELLDKFYRIYLIQCFLKKLIKTKKYFLYSYHIFYAHEALCFHLLLCELLNFGTRSGHLNFLISIICMTSSQESISFY